MASYSLSNITSDSVTFTVTGINYGDELWFFVRFTNDTSSSVVDSITTSYGSTYTRTFGGLSAGTGYTANVRLNGSWIGAKTFTTLSKTETGYWDWNASTARRNAYNALVNMGSTSQFSYLVWNEMVDKVWEVIQEKSSGWWNDAFLDLGSTYMTPSDRELTAARFNSLRYNVGSRYSTGVPEVSRGGVVYGWYFTQLMNKLNEWIDS